MSYIFNGKLIDQEQVLLPVDKNGSFWYGDGIFEAMRYEHKKILFIEQHWERINLSCSLLKMKNPFGTIEELKAPIELLANQLGNDLQRIKLVLWRNTFHAYQPEGEQVEYLVTSANLPKPGYLLNLNGLRLGIYTENLKSISRLGNIKSTSSQLYVLATLYTQSKNLDDSILLNTKKNPIETSRSNIWVVSNNTLYTPPLNEGCLDGVMRRVLLQICNEENIHVQQEPVSMSLLENAEEVFTSSAIRGIQWAASVEDRIYAAHTWATRLSELLHAKIK
jgi:branched-chain amino acid aminotransferase